MKARGQRVLEGTITAKGWVSGEGGKPRLFSDEVLKTTQNIGYFSPGEVYQKSGESN